MAYFSQSDIEQYTGFASTDAKIAGVTMNATQWATLCSNIVDWVTQTVNRWCNVTSFEWHLVTEYHDGKDSDELEELDEEYVFLLRETATGVQYLYVDEAAKGDVPDWQLRYERSAATAGDYEVDTRYELTKIRFHDDYPYEGYNNVKIIYYGGYATGANELNEIKLSCCRIAKNILLDKKHAQEAMTIRGTDIQDYAPMFDMNSDIFTDDIKLDLGKYRRYRLGGSAWD